MRENRGFMPFSAAGFLILMLVVALVGHAEWSKHQQAKIEIEDIAGGSPLTIASSIQGDLQHLARYAAYRALWDICKRASDFSNDEARELAIERLAAEYFMKHLTNSDQTYRHLNACVELELPDEVPSFDLRRADNGYALVGVKLPQGARIKVSSLDDNVRLALPCEKLEAFVDCRYFLLQERMNTFTRGLDDICSSWKWAEYLTAWGQALAGAVRLSESRSRALFKLAWADHELRTFGSSDYLAAMEPPPFQPSGPDRERAYELLPPAPIHSQPGLSVFHEFYIKDVKYEREDPLGWLGGARAPPTPVPLLLVGTTFYWAQWEVTLELEGKPVEEIFDFENPVLPRPLLEGEDGGLTNVHKPLGYRYEVPRERFSFKLIIISPSNFSIDVS